jgi:DNA-binding XRE family transcriptional regulator
MNEGQNSKIPPNKLREFRITPRISQWQLALTSGVKQSRISLIENRLVKPTMREKIKLAEALQHKIEEIFPDNARDDATDDRTDANDKTD